MKWIQKWSDFLWSHDKRLIKRVSYSQLYNWSKCPHLHWLISISKQIPYSSNTYTVFGYTVHESLEYQFLQKLFKKSLDFNSIKQYYLKVLQNEIERNSEFVVPSLMKELNANIFILHKNLDEYMSNTFGNYEIISIEESIDENIEYESEKFDYRMSGYIDLVIKDEQGKYHLIDFKTSKSGWNKWDRRDKTKYYQLILYKYFWMQGKNLQAKDIDVHYIFLKRNGKISAFSPTSGTKRMDNAYKMLKQMIWNAYEREFYIRKKGECKFCECRPFYQNQGT